MRVCTVESWQFHTLHRCGSVTKSNNSTCWSRMWIIYIVRTLHSDGTDYHLHHIFMKIVLFCTVVRCCNRVDQLHTEIFCWNVKSHIRMILYTWNMKYAMYFISVDNAKSVQFTLRTWRVQLESFYATINFNYSKNCAPQMSHNSERTFDTKLSVQQKSKERKNKF